MKQNQFLALLLAAAIFGMTACDFGSPKTSDDSGTDTQNDAPAVTDTQSPAAPDTDAPTPAVTDVPDETETEADTETVTEPVETEEITAPMPDLPPVIDEPVTEAPSEQETEAVTEPVTEDLTPTPSAPIEIARQYIDIGDALIPGGDPVTGQIASPQSPHLRLLLDYSLSMSEDGEVTLELDVGLSCYELWCSAKTDMGTISVNGVSRTFSTDPIDHMVNEKAYIPFLSQSYNATGGQSAAVEVSWNFNGKYGGADIGVLSAGLNLHWDTPSVTPPAEPVEPTEPTEPAPTEPVEPTEPTEPVEPTEPTEPVDPVAPPIQTDPTVDETEPIEPAEPVVPTEPVEPAEPVVPTDPAAPDVPVEPTDPGNPVVPVDPANVPTDLPVPPPEEAGTP